MVAIAGITFSVLSAILYMIAFIGMVSVGIHRLIQCQREGKSALNPPIGTTMERADYGRLFLWLLLSTLLVYAVGIIAQISNSEVPLSLHDAFLRAFQKSDALHYMEIAKNGYAAVGETSFFIVFFPLFPFLVRILAIFTCGHYILSAVLLNFTLMYVSIVTIFKLGIMDFPRDTVFYAIGFLLLFPVAFFFHNAYSEPLFLMTSSLSLYCTRRDRYALAGIIGFFCALSRASGVLCAVPLVARSFIGAWQSGRFHPLQWLKKAAWSIATLSGTGCYLWINYMVTGDALRFLAIESEHWHNGFTLFPNAVRLVTQGMLTNTYSHHVAFWIPQFLALFFFLVLLILGAKRLSTELSFYNCAFYLLMISQTWLLSGPRYLMTMFPAFFVLAMVLKSKTARIIVLVLSGIGLVLMTWLFAIGHCIY